MRALRRRTNRILWTLLGLLLACSDADPPLASLEAGNNPAAADRAETVWVRIAEEPFELELAIDPEVRFRGLGGRTKIARNGGMLFIAAAQRPQAMVMRDCPIPIDVAFLDDSGRVVALHAMQPEPPRGETETWRDYEGRLQLYESGVPAGFAVETAGGRLGELGVKVGDRLVFETRTLLARVRKAGV